jgi:diadenosine tetraphosphatase ApaH/serine/threonine PP2A family protein phosphatase
MERLELELGVHYERNNWTSSIVGDERNGGHETVVQGEMAFLYRLTEQAGLRLGFQRSQRRQSFEHEIVHNTNVSVGGIYRF